MRATRRHYDIERVLEGDLLFYEPITETGRRVLREMDEVYQQVMPKSMLNDSGGVGPLPNEPLPSVDLRISEGGAWLDPNIYTRPSPQRSLFEDEPHVLVVEHLEKVNGRKQGADIDVGLTPFVFGQAKFVLRGLSERGRDFLAARYVNFDGEEASIPASDPVTSVEDFMRVWEMTGPPSLTLATR